MTLKALLGLAGIAVLSGVPVKAGTVAITGTTAWTMTGRSAINNATIVITDGRVVSVLAGGAVPVGARIISGAGKTVTPALIDAATQIGLGEVGGIAEERSARIEKSPLGPAFDTQYALDANAVTIQQARADGLARALVYPDGSGSAPFDGAATLIRLAPGSPIVERARAAMFAATIHLRVRIIVPRKRASAPQAAQGND